MAVKESIESERLALRRSLIMGASRNPIEPPAWLATDDSQQGLLSLVAALGLRARFDRPPTPERLARSELRHDPARMPSDAARTVLRRLFGAKNQNLLPAVTLRIVDVLSERGVHLHPFDYPLLASMMTADESKLDHNARLWLSMQIRESTALSLDDIDDDNWTEFPPGARAQFLRQRRFDDPARARQLCEDAIGSDTAAVRCKLVESFSVGLGPADVQFLQGLEKDRAASVRNIALSLLARIDGTVEFAERISNAKSLLTLKSAGVIGRQKILAPAIPKGIAKNKLSTWMEDAFADVNPGELARAFDLSHQQFAKALSNPQLRALFFINAVDVQENELAALIAAQFDADNAWSVIVDARQRFAALAESQRQALWTSFTPVILASSTTDACSLLSVLYESLRIAPAPDLIESVVASKQWKQWLNRANKEADFDEQMVPELLITFAGADNRQAWRTRFADLPTAITSTASALADLFDAIESPN